jgi:DDE superfamily endonuclease
MAVSEKGWSSHFLGMEWLKHFDRRTRAMGRGEYIMLIVDGHGSHCTMEFYKYEYCVEAKRMILPNVRSGSAMIPAGSILDRSRIDP